MYTKNTHIHFVGIGGIGMSGIATILKKQGYTVSGCDPDVKQSTIDQLKQLGCSIYNENNAPGCDDATIDVLVYIPMYATTISTVATEIKRSQERNIPTISRARMLAELMRTKYSIAIAGSHGKTTTTSLISHVLIESETDPTVIIGGNLKNISSNMRTGNGNFLVAEADESDRSFLELSPTIAVITTIDLEHLETYRDLNDIKKAFKQFISHIPFYGKAVVCIDDENIRSILPHISQKIIAYGLEQNADIYANNIRMERDSSSFDVYSKKYPEKLGTVALPVPGKHNIYNCLAAIAVAQEINIPFLSIQKALASFAGVERRFSFHGIYKDAELFDDYGHHPKEIENALIIAHKRAQNKLTVIFQPHRYTRTQKLWSQFISTFTSAYIDTLIITDIYSAGETPSPTISSKNLADAIHKANPNISVEYAPFTQNFHHIKKAIDRSIQPNDLILFLGAGKIYHLAKELAE